MAMHGIAKYRARALHVLKEMEKYRWTVLTSTSPPEEWEGASDGPLAFGLTFIIKDGFFSDDTKTEIVQLNADRTVRSFEVPLALNSSESDGGIRA